MVRKTLRSMAADVQGDSFPVYDPKLFEEGRIDEDEVEEQAASPKKKREKKPKDSETPLKAKKKAKRMVNDDDESDADDEAPPPKSASKPKSKPKTTPKTKVKAKATRKRAKKDHEGSDDDGDADNDDIDIEPVVKAAPEPEEDVESEEISELSDYDSDEFKDQFDDKFYGDIEDRKRLMVMPEMQREAVLASRYEERKKLLARKEARLKKRRRKMELLEKKKKKKTPVKRVVKKRDSTSKVPTATVEPSPGVAPAPEPVKAPEPQPEPEPVYVIPSDIATYDQVKALYVNFSDFVKHINKPWAHKMFTESNDTHVLHHIKDMVEKKPPILIEGTNTNTKYSILCEDGNIRLEIKFVSRTTSRENMPQELYDAYCKRVSQQKGDKIYLTKYEAANKLDEFNELINKKITDDDIAEMIRNDSRSRKMTLAEEREQVVNRIDLINQQIEELTRKLRTPEFSAPDSAPTSDPRDEIARLQSELESMNEHNAKLKQKILEQTKLREQLKAPEHAAEKEATLQNTPARPASRNIAVVTPIVNTANLHVGGNGNIIGSTKKPESVLELHDFDIDI